MAVFRTIKNDNYTVMANYHLQDKSLSLKAKGILSMMLSFPEGWHYSINGLMAFCKESKNSINRALKELEDAKYLERNCIKENGKILKWEYVIYETNDEFMKSSLKKENLKVPHLKNEDTENEDMKNEDMKNAELRNGDAYKYTNKENTNKENTKETFRSLIENYTSNDDLKEALFGFVEMRKQKKKNPFTLRAMKINLNKLNKLANDDKTKIEIVEKTTSCGWSGFFPLDEKKTKNTIKDFPEWYKNQEQHEASQELIDEVNAMLEGIG